MDWTQAENLLPRQAESQTFAGRRWRDLVELSIGYGLILLAIWTPRPLQTQLSLLALAWVLLATAISFDGWSEMGLRIHGPLRSLWVVGVALLLAATAVLLAVWFGTLHLPGHPALFLQRYWAYAIWAFFQQLLLLDFFLLRLLRLLHGRRAAAVVAAAGLFALAHLPNPVLTPVTLFWGVVACLLFLEYRNVYTLALAHAICGICISVTVPGPVDHNMRVGLGYLTYHPPSYHQRSQKDHTVSTQAWVMAEAPTRRS
ncbi:MAG TPA: CPBP family intramembrane glutamic endopeptidase [Acidisarcina sp.]|nr:CPBP family intramembrane glutamic endopeptidase [Acidisarcina sp.]